MMNFDQRSIETQVLRRVQSIEQARAAVTPVIGHAAAMALDSVAGLYCAGLKELGINTNELRGQDAAAQAAFSAVSTPRVKSSPIATPAQRAERHERFPNADRLQRRT